MLHLQTTIQTMLQANASQREIERVTGISRHTIRAYQKCFADEAANCSGVTTGPEAVPASQTAPPRPPAVVPAATSLCEPHRKFIEVQLRLKRNAMAIFQDLVDQHRFAGHYNSVKRFVRAGAAQQLRCPPGNHRLQSAGTPLRLGPVNAIEGPRR